MTRQLTTAPAPFRRAGRAGAYLGDPLTTAPVIDDARRATAAGSGSIQRPASGLRQRRRHPSGFWRCLGLLLVASLTGCGGVSGLHTAAVVGLGRRHVELIVDDRATPALAGVFAAYGRRRHVRMFVRSGTSPAIAGAVKDGATVDVVVITGGPPLSRVRDELAARALALGSYRSIRYWAAPVTDVGEGFVAFLRSSAGVAVLRSRGFTG